MEHKAVENNNLSFLPLFTNQCNDRYVFKCRFSYYSDMVKPTDQETIAIERVCYPHSLQEKGRARPWRAKAGCSGDGKNGRKMWARAFFRGFHKKQWAGQGKWAYLAGLNRYSGLWGLRSVSSCLVPGPVVIRAEEEWPIFCKNSVKEVVEGGALDWSVCTGKAGSLQGANSRISVAPRRQQIKKMENKKT